MRPRRGIRRVRVIFRTVCAGIEARLKTGLVSLLPKHALGRLVLRVGIEGLRDSSTGFGLFPSHTRSGSLTYPPEHFLGKLAPTLETIPALVPDDLKTNTFIRGSRHRFPKFDSVALRVVYAGEHARFPPFRFHG